MIMLSRGPKKSLISAFLLTLLGTLLLLSNFVDISRSKNAYHQSTPEPGNTSKGPHIRPDTTKTVVSITTSAVASQHSHNSDISRSLLGGVNYTDPLDITRHVFYGPWQGKIPHTVVAGEQFMMEFICTYPDWRMCPTHYMVLFHGPSRQSVLPDAFTPPNWTFNSPHEYVTVRATWTIHDPGLYNVYAYPQFIYCERWKDMDWPWEKATVQGSPFQLTVQTKPADASLPADTEGYGTCAANEVDIGRYLSTNASETNPQFAAMYEGLNRKFVWAPYKCKVPPRTWRHALDLIPSAKHFLFVGDSQTRGGFCTRVWNSVHGTVYDSVCDSINSVGGYWDQRWGHKFTSVILEKNENRAEERNISFSFLWVASDFDTLRSTLLSQTDPPPSHVVFNMGLWVAWEDVDSLQKIYWNFLTIMNDNFPSVEHIILRTTTSVVQAVQCYGEYNIVYSDEARSKSPPDDSLDFRIGGAKKRHAIYEVARRWNDRFKENPPFRVSVVDVWQLTDNRPETTTEGRHWMQEGSDKSVLEKRPGIGEAEGKTRDFLALIKQIASRIES